MKVRELYAWVIATVLVSGCTGNAQNKATLPPKGEASPATAPESAPPAAKEASQPATAGTETHAASQQPAAAPAESPAPSTATSAPAVAPAAAAPAAEHTAKPSSYRLTGEVRSLRKSQIAFRVAGFIEKVSAKAGMIVQKDEVLATLDDQDFVLRVELAKARRDQAKVAYESLKKDFQREAQLKKEKVSTDTVYEKVEASVEQARLSFRLAEIELTTATRALNDTKLKAPYEGIVAAQMKHDGESVQSGTAVFEIYDLKNPEIVLTAPERLVGDLKVGSKLQVNIPSASFQGQAEIIRLVPVISEKTRSFELYARLAGTPTEIVPGSYAEASVN